MMSRIVACAVTRDDPPRVFLADDQETLNWVLALKLIARTPSSSLSASLREELRSALRSEQWGEAVALWMREGPEIDVYPSFAFYSADDVELAAMELEFTPLFVD
jgi:hypothetical protein